MACFGDINDINFLQDSVATYARCGGIFNVHVTANFCGESFSETYSKSVKISENYGQLWPRFLATL